MTELQYRTNTAFDTVLLVVDGHVRNDWMVDAVVMHEFCDCSQDAADWDDGFSDESPEVYGQLIAVRRGYTLKAIDVGKWTARVAFMVH
jgi:hypothetical protein